MTMPTSRFMMAATAPYVKTRKKSTLPLTKGFSPDTITLEEALPLLEARAKKAGTSKKKATKTTKSKAQSKKKIA